MPDSAAGRGRRESLDPLGSADIVPATDWTAVMLEFERRFTSYTNVWASSLLPQMGNGACHVKNSH